jgi:hypothetical protein
VASNFPPMRYFPALLLLWTVVGCRANHRTDSLSADSPGPDAPATASSMRSPVLARRADSLAKLDPQREARAAIARGDLRFIAVCGYVCVPVGVPLDRALRTRDSLAVRSDSLRIVLGTSDGIANEDVARLNDVAAQYASRYNRLIWDQRLKMQSVARPAT